MRDQTLVFVGPTAHGLHDRLRSSDFGFTFRPPVKRNDLVNLSSCFGRIVLVDGAFQSVPAVGHAEIRRLLGQREVYGCSSLGAIRAYEMRHLGMIGVGAVYRMFERNEDFTDDEVALLHRPAPDYAPMSEPLVNVRFLLTDLVTESLIAPGAADQIVESLASMYFGHRNLALIGRLMEPHLVGITKAAALSRLSRNRVKTRDFLDLLCSLDTRFTSVSRAHTDRMLRGSPAVGKSVPGDARTSR